MSLGSPNSVAKRMSTAQALSCWNSYKNLMQLKCDSKPKVAEDAQLAFQRLSDRLAMFMSLSLHCPAATLELHYFSIGIFTNLEELRLDMVPLSTIEDLYVLRGKLRVLVVANSGIPDLQTALVPIDTKYIRKLAPMILAPTTHKYANTSPQHHWAALEVFQAVNCGITCMDQSYHFMPRLTMLDMSFNDIAHIAHLQDCYMLNSINLSHNRIRVLSNVERVLGNVIKLDLSYNRIESLDGLEKLHSIQKIDLSFNRINDFNEVSALCKLPNLASMYLDGNPISNVPQYRIAVFKIFLSEGAESGTGAGAVPALDGAHMSDTEAYALRGQMFRTTENDEKELSSSLAVRGAARSASGSDNAEVSEGGVEDSFQSPMSMAEGRRVSVSGSGGGGAGKPRLVPLNSVSADAAIVQRLKSNVAPGGGAHNGIGIGMSTAAALLQQQPPNGRGGTPPLSPQHSQRPPRQPSPSVSGSNNSQRPFSEALPPGVRTVTPPVGVSSEMDSAASYAQQSYSYAQSRSAMAKLPSKYRGFLAINAMLDGRAKHRQTSPQPHTGVGDAEDVASRDSNSLRMNSDDFGPSPSADCGNEAVCEGPLKHLVEVHDSASSADISLPNLERTRQMLKQKRQQQRDEEDEEEERRRIEELSAARLRNDKRIIDSDYADPDASSCMVPKFRYTTASMSKSASQSHGGRGRSDKGREHDRERGRAANNGVHRGAPRTLQEEIDADDDDDDYDVDGERNSFYGSPGNGDNYEGAYDDDDHGGVRRKQFNPDSSESGDEPWNSNSRASQFSEASTAIVGQRLSCYSAITDDYAILRAVTAAEEKKELEREREREREEEQERERERERVRAQKQEQEQEQEQEQKAQRETQQGKLQGRDGTQEEQQQPQQLEEAQAAAQSVDEADNSGSTEVVVDFAAVEQEDRPGAVTAAEIDESDAVKSSGGGDAGDTRSNENESRKGDDEEDDDDCSTYSAEMDAVRRGRHSSTHDAHWRELHGEGSVVASLNADAADEEEGGDANAIGGVGSEDELEFHECEEEVEASSGDVTKSSKAISADLAGANSSHEESREVSGAPAPDLVAASDEKFLNSAEATNDVAEAASVSPSTPAVAPSPPPSADPTPVVVSYPEPGVYIGNMVFGGYVVNDHLELYFKEQVFAMQHHAAEVIEGREQERREAGVEEGNRVISPLYLQYSEEELGERWEGGTASEALAQRNRMRSNTEGSVVDYSNVADPVESEARLGVRAHDGGIPWVLPRHRQGEALAFVLHEDSIELPVCSQSDAAMGSLVVSDAARADDNDNGSDCGDRLSVASNSPKPQRTSSSSSNTTATTSPVVRSDSSGLKPFPIGEIQSVAVVKSYIFAATASNLYVMYYDPTSAGNRHINAPSNRAGAAAGNAIPKVLSNSNVKYAPTSSVAAAATSPVLKFSDAPVFTVLGVHPLREFRQYTLFFSYQRCALEFTRTLGVKATTLEHCVVTDDDESSASAASSVPFRKFSPGTKDLICAPAAAAEGGGRYMILTRDKSKTISFITKLYQLANAVRAQYRPLSVTNTESLLGSVASEVYSSSSHAPSSLLLTNEHTSGETVLARLPKVVIQNNESQLLDVIHKFIHQHHSTSGGKGGADAAALAEDGDDNEVIYYQMLYQLNADGADISTSASASDKKTSAAPPQRSPRTIILTPSLVLLCDEDLSSTSVDLKVVDQGKYQDIVAIKPHHDNPLCVTLVLKPSTKRRASIFGGGSKNQRQWVLCAVTRGVIEKLNTEVRRQCQAKGNTAIK